MKCKPDIICIQESWLKPRLDFVIKGYSDNRRDRGEGKPPGGGCITFIKKGLQHREVKRGKELEYVVTEVWTKQGRVSIINFYNPCDRLTQSQLEEIWENLNGKVIWCGDFNGHSSLWGDKDDANGSVIEEFLDENELVCLNDGSCTRVDVSRGTESAIDLTIASKDIAEKM